MFAGLTPIMAHRQRVDGKRKGRKTERGEKERFARELVELPRAGWPTLADDERRRREPACPDPAEIARRVTLPSTTLWERRPGAPPTSSPAGRGGRRAVARRRWPTAADPGRCPTS